MPFTPFHFGPGLFVKSIAFRYFSFTTFIVSQVVIDLETLYFLATRQWPLHRELHTFLGGAAAGLGTAILVWVVGRGLLRRLPTLNTPLALTELRLLPTLIGGAVGGLSHSVLDGLMHSDIRPFRPLLSENPLYRLVDVGVLHLLCVAAGLIAGIILFVRYAHASRRLTRASS